MELTLENLPYLCLLWIGVGFIIILIGVFIMAYIKYDDDYTAYTENTDEDILRKIYKEESSFLEVLKEKKEEEKSGQVKVYDEIRALYIAGKTEGEIAKSLNIGLGEVQLILSLYKMR